jgi:hypothetical protein
MSEMSVDLNHLPWLLAQIFIEFCHSEHLRDDTHTVLFSSCLVLKIHNFEKLPVLLSSGINQIMLKTKYVRCEKGYYLQNTDQLFCVGVKHG